jgi:hypothetical protein
VRNSISYKTNRPLRPLESPWKPSCNRFSLYIQLLVRANYLDTTFVYSYIRARRAGATAVPINNRFPQQLGPSSGHLGAILGQSWGNLVTILGYFGPIMGPSCAILGPSCGHLGHISPSLGHLGASLKPSWAIFDPCWGHLAAILRPSWGRLGHPGTSWAILAPSWAHLDFGAMLEMI